MRRDKREIPGLALLVIRRNGCLERGRHRPPALWLRQTIDQSRKSRHSRSGFIERERVDQRLSKQPPGQVRADRRQSRRPRKLRRDFAHSGECLGQHLFAAPRGQTSRERRERHSRILEFGHGTHRSLRVFRTESGRKRDVHVPATPSRDAPDRREHRLVERLGQERRDALQAEAERQLVPLRDDAVERLA